MEGILEQPSQLNFETVAQLVSSLKEQYQLNDEQISILLKASVSRFSLQRGQELFLANHGLEAEFTNLIMVLTTGNSFPDMTIDNIKAYLLTQPQYAPVDWLDFTSIDDLSNSILQNTYLLYSDVVRLYETIIKTTTDKKLDQSDELFLIENELGDLFEEILEVVEDEELPEFSVETLEGGIAYLKGVYES